MQKIYLVDIRNILDDHKRYNMLCLSDIEFKEEAIQQGQVYDISEFIRTFNIGTDTINNQHQFIRMFEESEE